MGQWISTHTWLVFPDLPNVPDLKNPSKFPDDFGYTYERKERKMIATKAEMDSAKIPDKLRDYCAHLLIDFEACRKHNFPWYYKCNPVKHEYLHCEMEDDVLRLKHYERERRLLERKARKEAKAAHKEKCEE